MKKYIIITILILGVLAQGCKKYLDVNDDPNLVKNPPINSLLVNSTYQTGLNVQRMGNITSYYVQYLASPNTGSDRDIYKEEDLSGTWSAHYNVLTDIKQMVNLGIQRGATEHVGVGKILTAVNLNMLINMFGDVPYSQALMGKDILNPKFDDQKALHDTTLRLIDEAIAELNKPTPTIRLDASSDRIHSGSVAAWKKTAYGLKARFLNQISKTAAYNPGEILTALSNSYTSNSDDALLTSYAPGINSPWNQVARNNANLLLDGWLSEQFVDALDGSSFPIIDPRLRLITDTTKFGDYRGTPNGAGRIGSGTAREESVLTTTGFYSKAGAPLLLVTYAEMKFIEAEAAFRSNDKPKAYAAYLAGIRAHMDRLVVPTAARDAYLAAPVVAVGATNLTLADIFKEKYVAMFLHPETWVDARRFNYAYKDFTLPVNAALTSYIRRSAYPVVETSRNGINVPTVTLLTRLWWDQ